MTALTDEATALAELRSKPMQLGAVDPLCASSCAASAFHARPNAISGTGAEEDRGRRVA